MTATARVREAVDAIRADAEGQANEKLAAVILAGMDAAMDAVDDGGKMNAAMLGKLIDGADALDRLIDVAAEDDPLTRLRAVTAQPTNPDGI